MTILRISDVIEDRHATSLLACLYPDFDTFF